MLTTSPSPALRTPQRGVRLYIVLILSCDTSGRHYLPSMSPLPTHGESEHSQADALRSDRFLARFAIPSS